MKCIKYNNKFEAKRKTAKFCSDKCRNNYRDSGSNNEISGSKTELAGATSDKQTDTVKISKPIFINGIEVGSEEYRKTATDKEIIEWYEMTGRGEIEDSDPKFQSFLPSFIALRNNYFK